MGAWVTSLMLIGTMVTIVMGGVVTSPPVTTVAYCSSDRSAPHSPQGHFEEDWGVEYDSDQPLSFSD
jgi:hypothetical protein